MREIKFRAWDKEAELMAYWEEIDQLDADGLLPFLEMLKDDRHMIMQYAGLKDKNGKEIYEEDVARNKYGSIGIIKFHETWCAFYFSTVFGHNEDGQFVPMISSVPMWNEWNTLEVIGNIYENPDLLKEDKPCTT